MPVPSRTIPALRTFLVIGVVVLLAACSSGSDSSSTPTTARSTTAATATTISDASPGCNARAPGHATDHVDLGGRSYRRTVPPKYVARVPLPAVIDLHGYSEGADHHALTTHFEDLGATERFVTLTPQALGDIPAWDLSPTGRDVVFVADVLDDAERSLCIDTSRVYVTGHSMGAFLISVLACSPFAGRIAAWAPVAGLRDVPDCHTSGEPVVITHGTDDRTVYYEGGLSDAAARLLFQPIDGPSIPVLAASWAARNGCGNATPSERSDGAVTEISYPCDVVLRRVEHGPHVWPPTTTRAIWDFFTRYRERSTCAHQPRCAP